MSSRQRHPSRKSHKLQGGKIGKTFRLSRTRSVQGEERVSFHAHRHRHRRHIGHVGFRRPGLSPERSLDSASRHVVDRGPPIGVLLDPHRVRGAPDRNREGVVDAARPRYGVLHRRGKVDNSAPSQSAPLGL